MTSQKTFCKTIFISRYFNSVDKDLMSLAESQMNRLFSLHSITASFAGNQQKCHQMALIGGYNCVDKIGKNNFLNLKKIKSFCGYSDLTTFLLYLLYMKSAIPIHGPMFLPDFSEYDVVANETLLSYLSIVRGLDNATNVEQTWNCNWEYQDINWFNKHRWLEPRPVIKNNEPLLFVRDTARTKGKYKGISLGGNLTIFLRHLTSSYFPQHILQTENILFLEDDMIISPDDLKNLFVYLILSKCLVNTVLIVLGSLKTVNNCNNDLTHKISYWLSKRVNIPVMCNVAFGHRQPNYSFVLGCQTTVDYNKGVINIIQEVNRYYG